MRPSYRIVSYRIEKKTLISYRYRIESKKSLSLLDDSDSRGEEKRRRRKMGEIFGEEKYFDEINIRTAEEKKMEKVMKGSSRRFKIMRKTS